MAGHIRAASLACPHVNKLCIFVGTTVFSTIGWYLGDPFGFFTAFVLSGIGSIFGVYVGWKAAQKFLS